MQSKAKQNQTKQNIFQKGKWISHGKHDKTETEAKITEFHYFKNCSPESSLIWATNL